MIFSQLLFVSLLPLTLAGTQLRLVHRVYLPLGGPVPFAERGTLHIADDGLSAEFTPSNTVGQDLQQFANVLHDISPDGALYQVGLEREGDMDYWDVSSVKAVGGHSSFSKRTHSLPFHSVIFRALPQIHLYFKSPMRGSHTPSIISSHRYPMMEHAQRRRPVRWYSHLSKTPPYIYAIPRYPHCKAPV
jgi:hypothetical protein